MIEIWKDVVGLEDYAEISNLGAVRTKDRYINNNGTQVLRKGKIKKATDNGLGYLQLRFYIDGKTIRKYLHVAVAEAFIEKPTYEGKLEVNHKDGDKSNNAFYNLEWISHSENIKHAMKSGLLGREGSLWSSAKNA